MFQALRRLGWSIFNDSFLTPSQNRVAYNLSPSADGTGSPKTSEGKSALWKTSKGAGAVYYSLRFFLIFFITITANSHASVMQQVQDRIAYINGESLSDRHPVQCIGLVTENDKLLITSGCTKENTFSENTPVISLRNSTIGYFSSTDKLENNSYLKEYHPELSENEKFYIYTENPIEIWMPVQLSKVNEDTFSFSSTASKKQKITMGAPVINDRGDIICLNNGNNYCESPSKSAEFSISSMNTNCSISSIPFPCKNPTWRVCNTTTQEGIGQCYREYDLALCNVTLNGHASDVKGTLSCYECHADWLENGNQTTKQVETPKGCMSHHVTDKTWWTPRVTAAIAGGSAMAVMFVFTGALGCIFYHKVWKKKHSYEQI